jgi:hypothetical protein
MRSLLAFLVALAATTAALASCSDDDSKSSNAAGDGGDADGNRAAEDEPQSTQSCREECEKEHPNGRKKSAAIDTCWKDHCQAACVDQTGASGTFPDAGSCQGPVITPTPECDECTNANCCAAWDDCFADQECGALNACYIECAQ